MSMIVLAASLGIVSIHHAIHGDVRQALLNGVAIASLAAVIEGTFGNIPAAAILGMYTLVLVIPSEDMRVGRGHMIFQRAVRNFIFDLTPPVA